MGLLIFIFGLIIGSFLNVMIWRLYKKESFSGRSKCIHCKSKIPWYYNIPLFGFIILKGKCRICKKKISWQYPLVELATGIIFVVAYLQIMSHQISPSPQWGEGGGEGAILLRNFIFISFLIIIFVHDFRWMYILDSVTIPAGIVAIILNILIGMDWMTLVFGGIIGGGFFLAQYLLSSGKWIGGGDIRLGCVMGCMLGWKMVIVALFIAYFVGAVISVFLILIGKKRFSSKIPFGTFLSATTIATLLYGEEILRWYLDIIHLTINF